MSSYNQKGYRLSFIQVFLQTGRLEALLVFYSFSCRSVGIYHFISFLLSGVCSQICLTLLTSVIYGLVVLQRRRTDIRLPRLAVYDINHTSLTIDHTSLTLLTSLAHFTFHFLIVFPPEVTRRRPIWRSRPSSPPWRVTSARAVRCYCACALC